MVALAGDAAQAIVPLIVRLEARSPLDPASGVSATLRAVESARPSAFEALAVGAWALSARLGQLVDLRSDVMAALNTAEAGEGSVLSPIRWEGVPLEGERWRAEFEALRRLRGAALGSGERTAALPPDGAESLDLEERVLDRQVDAAKIVNVLAAVRERWQRFVIAGRVLSWRPVVVPDRRVPWLIDVRYGFGVKPLSLLGPNVVVRRQRREASFRIGAPSAAAFSVVTGLVLTSSSRHVFDGRTGPDGVRRIVATQASGGPARLLVAVNWRPAQSLDGRFGAWPVRPLLQAGAIADAKQPGAALGVGIDVRRWLHLSAGRAWQPQTVLDGQQTGDVLASGEAVTTVSALAPSWYASVGVSLGALPFFRR